MDSEFDSKAWLREAAVTTALTRIARAAHGRPGMTEAERLEDVRDELAGLDAALANLESQR